MAEAVQGPGSPGEQQSLPVVGEGGGLPEEPVGYCVLRCLQQGGGSLGLQAARLHRRSKQRRVHRVSPVPLSGRYFILLI